MGLNHDHPHSHVVTHDRPHGPLQQVARAGRRGVLGAVFLPGTAEHRNQRDDMQVGWAAAASSLWLRCQENLADVQKNRFLRDAKKQGGGSHWRGLPFC